MRSLPALLIGLALIATTSGLASAEKVSHKGWPKIDGKLKRAPDGGGTVYGTERSDELLGGHGSDTIVSRGASDVVWGDARPNGGTGQHDNLDSGAGNDFIYASHGYNNVQAGTGADKIHAHYGNGKIDCGGGKDIVYLSHRSRPHYKLKGCEKISYANGVNH